MSLKKAISITIIVILSTISCITSIECNDFGESSPIMLQDNQTVASIELQHYQQIEFDITIKSICSHDIDNGGGANDCNVFWIGTNAAKTDRVIGLWTRTRKSTMQTSWEPRFASNDNWNNVISITDPAPTVGTHHFSMLISLNEVIISIDNIFTNVSGTFNRSDYFGTTYDIAFSSPDWSDDEWEAANATLSNICVESWDDISAECSDFGRLSPLILKVDQTVETMQVNQYQEIEFDININSICSHSIDNGGGANDCNILWIGSSTEKTDRAMGLWTRTRKTSLEKTWEPRFGSTNDWNNAITISDPAPTAGLHHFYMFISPNEVIVSIDNIFTNFTADFTRTDYFGIDYNIAFGSPDWNEWEVADATVSNICLRSWSDVVSFTTTDNFVTTDHFTTTLSSTSELDKLSSTSELDTTISLIHAPELSTTLTLLDVADESARISTALLVLLCILYL